MSNPTQKALHEAGLQDIPGSALQEAIPNLKARNSKFADVEYGIRTDDGRLVMHFYPPGWALTRTPATWPDWSAFRDRLERALLSHFAKPQLEAGFVEELQSFWVLAQVSPAFDHTRLIESFFRELEGESPTALETPP